MTVNSSFQESTERLVWSAALCLIDLASPLKRIAKSNLKLEVKITIGLHVALQGIFIPILKLVLPTTKMAALAKLGCFGQLSRKPLEISFKRISLQLINKPTNNSGMYE